MKTIRHNTPMIVLFLMTCAALSSLPPIAQAEEFSRWELKTSAVAVDAGGTYSIDQPFGGQTQADGDMEIGIGIAIEYRLSDLLSLELARVSATTMDIDYRADGNSTRIGEGVSFSPILAGTNFHITNTNKFDIYAGPRIAYVNFGGFTHDIGGQIVAIDVDNEFGWGATAGLKYRFGDSQWSLLAEMTYLDVDMKATDRGTGETFVNGFDPLMATVGLSHRF